MTLLAERLLSLCDRNPLHPSAPVTRYQVFRVHRESGTGILFTEPTEHVFTTYREADNKADELSADVTGFWFEVYDAEEDDS